MSDDLFPGFDSHSIDTEEATLFCRTGGSGPALLLIHGYPQSHHMWHKVAPTLAEHFTLVMPDLRGYGASSAPASGDDHAAYSKRAMARDMLDLMAAFGHDQFRLAGHDRGGRVAYRLALDFPEHVVRIACLDIVTTLDTWNAFDWAYAIDTYHWTFLAQPEPLPEMLLAQAPEAFLDYTLASWTADKTLDAFDPTALAAYRRAFARPSTIHATCEDYRAGAGYDRDADQADIDSGNQIVAPLLAVFGTDGIPPENVDGKAIWSRWAKDVTAGTVPSGHFMCEEAPDAVLDHLLPFMKR